VKGRALDLASRTFRVARPDSRNRILVKTGLQIVGVWGFALGLLPALAVQADTVLGLPRWRSPRRRPLGLVLLVAGSALGLTSAWVMADKGKGTPIPFDAARELVVVGPYRVVRNPMVLGAISQTTGIAILLGSPSVAAIPVTGIVVWNAMLRPPEEKFLADRFGDSYRRYQDAVTCWFPTWPPYTT